MAVLVQVPFAVIPCCVFANQNTGRTLVDGTAVRSISQYVQYLQMKVIVR